ncbi:hypothetical protein R1flu_021771 [Riccia fluitans]|uniref:Secreted protein n=1 Tax=Riccia fluitans TaxID=41844 RepID=A0ABD1ZQJ0_9MARC
MLHCPLHFTAAAIFVSCCVRILVFPRKWVCRSPSITGAFRIFEARSRCIQIATGEGEHHRDKGSERRRDRGE